MAVPCVLRAKDTLTGLTTLLLHQHNQLSYSFSFHCTLWPKLNLGGHVNK